MSGNGPRALRTLLERWEPTTERAAPEDAQSAIAVAWPDVVGADVARRTRVGKLQDNVLTVYTAGSTWSHQLTFLAPSIVAELGVRCPQARVTRLRFVVASGRTKALLDGLARRVATADAPRPVARTETPVDDAADDAEDIVRRLRRRQLALDRRRERDGWTRCERCGVWMEPAIQMHPVCDLCTGSARQALDNHIERMLAGAPWLKAADVIAHSADVDERAFERVRRRLLSRWEEQLFAARARLRRLALHATDRVVAWSYLMLRSGKQQHEIGRAVVADALGEQWADALATATSPARREAPRTRVQKQKNTNARVFTRRDIT